MNGIAPFIGFSAMIQKRLTPLLLTGTLLLLLFCAQATNSTTGLLTASAQSSTTPTDRLAEATDVTTLRWFTRWDAERIDTIAVPMLAQFHAENPTIRVQLENVDRGDTYYHRLRLALASGQPPDIFYPATHVAYDLAQRGQLFPLDDFIHTDGLDLTTYGSDQLDLYRDETAQLYCLPIDVATLAVAYNRSLFDAAGITYPQAPWTWDDLLATARQLTQDTDGDGVVDQYGIDRFYTYWPLLVWSWTGHNVFDNPQLPTAFLLEEEESVRAVQWLADLHLRYGVIPPVGGITGEENLFLAGRAAMQITGHWQLPSYLAANLDVDVAPLPIGEYAANRSDGSCLAIANTSAHPQEAWTLLKFLAGPSGIGARMLRDQHAQSPAVAALYQQSFFINPLHLLATEPTDTTTPSAPPLTTASLAAWSGVSTLSRFPLYDPLHPLFMEWQPIVDKELTAVWNGKRSADEAIGRMANAAENLLEDLPVRAMPVVEPGAALNERIPFLAPSAQELAVGPRSAFMSSKPLSSTVRISTTSGGESTGTLPLIERESDPFSSPLNLPRHYFVASTGDDASDGLRVTAPLATIQHALDLVAAGDTIHLAAGDYLENLTSVTAGRADAPITIMGPQDAILRGAGQASAAFYLTHDYYTLTGFTIDGLFGDPTIKKGYTQKLLYVQGKDEKSGVTGLRVLHMRFQNAGGECVRLRYFAQHNEIAYSSFHVCGLLDFVFGNGGKNGEAIYIGTASNQWGDGKNPTADPDESSYNWIHHNVINTQGNECIEVKEGGYENVIEYNLCTGQLDPDSAGLGTRGSNNILRYNTAYKNIGAGIRLGGHYVDGIQYGIDNEVYGNHLFNNRAGGVKFSTEPQRRVCGNQLEPNLQKPAFGNGSDGYEPTVPC